MDSTDSMATVARRVHVVEDHDLVRSLLSTWLASRGHRVFSYGSLDVPLPAGIGAEDVVLLDLCLGDTDGTDVLQSLAEQSFAGDVILISAFPQSVIDAARAVASGFGLRVRGALRKPVDFERLTEFLETAHEPHGHDKRRRLGTPSLAEALAADHVTFHFQPILDADTLELQSIEMLARLIDRAGGEHSIGTMLATADINALDELARIAFDAVGDLGLVLDRRGVSRLPIAINIPSSLLQRGHFLPVIERARHADTQITLEISELDSFENLPDARRMTTSAVLRGLRFSLDDFGTLNSNIDRFSQIPFDELKIDRGYVAGCADDPFRDAVCRFAVELARLRHAIVVAEGVENEADLTHLREIGVDRVQGYLFSPPLPSKAIVDWIIAHRPRAPAPTQTRHRRAVAGGTRA